MTNDEAIQWCSDKNVRVTFIQGPTPRVQVHVQIPQSSGPSPWAARARGDFLEALAAVQVEYDAVLSGAKRPSDTSLVDLRYESPMPPAPSVE